MNRTAMQCNKVLLFVSLMLLVNCTSAQNKKIKTLYLNYVSFDLQTDGRVDCENFEIDFQGQFKRIKLTDHNSINAFSSYLQKMSKMNYKRGDVDVRTKIYIYYNSQSVDTLCLGKFSGRLNGKPVRLEKGFIDLIKKFEFDQ